MLMNFAILEYHSIESVIDVSKIITVLLCMVYASAQFVTSSTLFLCLWAALH
jgi:hypothetical protein